MPQSTKQVYRCKQCQKSFLTKTKLSSHVSVIHNNEKDFECKQCGKKFGYDKSLYNHVMKSLDEDYKNKIKLVKEKAKLVPSEHKCDYCGNAFKTKVTLVQHKKSLHSDIRPYKCRECPSTFKRSGHLKLHEILVHQNSREFQCKLCPKSFNTKTTLRAFRIQKIIPASFFVLK